MGSWMEGLPRQQEEKAGCFGELGFSPEGAPLQTLCHLSDVLCPICHWWGLLPGVPPTPGLAVRCV